MSNGVEQFLLARETESKAATSSLLSETLALSTPGSISNDAVATANQFLPPAEQVLSNQTQPRGDGAYTGATPTTTGLDKLATPMPSSYDTDLMEPEGYYYRRPSNGAFWAGVGLSIAANAINRNAYGRGYYGGGWGGYGGGWGGGYYNDPYYVNPNVQFNRFNGYVNGWPVNQNAYFGVNTWNGYGNPGIIIGHQHHYNYPRYNNNWNHNHHHHHNNWNNNWNHHNHHHHYNNNWNRYHRHR